MIVSERLRSFLARLHPAWRFLLPLATLLLVMGIAAAIAAPFYGKAAMEGYRDWQTKRMLGSAIAAMEAGNHAEARQLAMHVSRNKKFSERALPIAMRSTDEMGDARSESLARLLLHSGSGTPGDRLRAWGIVCRNSPAWFVAHTWSKLTAEEMADEGYVTPVLDRFLRDGMLRDVRRTVEKHPKPWSTELSLRYLRALQAGGEADRSRFFRELAGALDERPEGKERLLPLLDDISLEELPEEFAKGFASHAEEFAAAGSEEALRLARLRMAARPDAAEAVFRAAYDLHRGAEELVTARWCLRLGRVSEAMELIGEMPVGEEAEAFRVACAAAEQAGDLASWGALLAKPPADATTPEILCDRAYVAGHLNDGAIRSLAEKTALDAAAAEFSPDSLIRLARHAERRGLEGFARRAWLQAIRKGQGPLPLSGAIEPLIEHFSRMKLEPELWDIVATYRVLEPGNPGIFLRHSYLSCLTRRTPPAVVVRDLEPLHQRSPNDGPARFALAVALLMDRRHEEALELTKGAPPQALSGQAAYQAIHGIALAANGHDDESRVWLDDLRWDILLPSERQVFRALLANPGSTDLLATLPPLVPLPGEVSDGENDGPPSLAPLPPLEAPADPAKFEILPPLGRLPGDLREPTPEDAGNDR